MLRNYEALKAYVNEHHHLPAKTFGSGEKYLLDFAKYTRKPIKEGTCDEGKKEMFESLMKRGRATSKLVADARSQKMLLGQVTGNAF